MKLLAAKGVKNREEAEKAIQQLLTVQQQSKIKDFETFLQGGTKSIIDAMTYGASWDMALGQFGSAMDVIMTGDEAATATKQIHELMQKEKVAAEVGKMHGMTEEEFRNLPQDQKLIAFESWISKNAGTGAGQKYLIEQGGLSPTELGNAMKLYNQKQAQRIRYFKGLSEGATAGQFRAEAEGYAKSTAGQEEEAEAEKMREEASATDQEILGMNLMTEAEGRITTLTRQGKEPYPMAGEDRKRKTVARDILRERYEKLRSDVEAAGRLEEFEREFEAYEESLEYMNKFSSPGGIEILPSELGEAEQRRRKMEKTVVHNYTFNQSRDVIYVRDIDPAYPRVGNTDVA